MLQLFIPSKLANLTRAPCAKERIRSRVTGSQRWTPLFSMVSRRNPFGVTAASTTASPGGLNSADSGLGIPNLRATFVAGVNNHPTTVASKLNAANGGSGGPDLRQVWVFAGERVETGAQKTLLPRMLAFQFGRLGEP